MEVIVVVLMAWYAISKISNSTAGRGFKSGWTGKPMKKVKHKCDYCNGRGTSSRWSSQKCTNCNGSGSVWY